MTFLKHIFYISVVTFLLASCASYGVISENDVYLQKPAAIDLTDDQQDITSFNSYKAGRNGAFQNGDNRLSNTNARAFATYNSRFMFGTYYNPFHYYYPTDPFIWGRPYGYGYGLNSPMYGMNTFYSPGFGYGYSYDYYNYGFGPFMSPYYGHSHFYFGSGYYNYGYNTTYGTGNHSSSGNQFYGHRSSLSGNSRRSSSYPQTLQGKKFNNVKTVGSNVNSKNLASKNIQNRRKVSNTEREYVRPNVNASRNSSMTTKYSGTNRNPSISATNPRRNASSTNNYRNRSYTPSNTARRTGTVSRSNTDRRTSGPYNSSNNTRRSNYNSGNNSSRGSYSSPQRSTGNSYNRSSGSSNRSSGPSSRSNSGSSSSSGRR